VTTPTSSNDRDVLRELASRWMELASLPVMAERKRQWATLKDLRAERPMVLFETWTLENYVEESELKCTDPALRGIEFNMRHVIRQVEEVNDDTVVEPVWRMGWSVSGTDYGVPLITEGAEDIEGGHVGYHYNHPIQTPADVEKLKPRSWCVDREASHRQFERVSGIFGDIMPVKLHGTQDLHAALTGDLFRLLGNDNLLIWVYDEPETIHKVMAYLRDDRLAYFAWMEEEGLLGLNDHFTFVGSGSPGYTKALPAADYAGKARLKDVWVWMESQETTSISPSMFTEFFLPYMAEVSAMFGLIYYGCCEPVHDRWQPITQAIPHIRAVSVSPWCDMNSIAAQLGRDVVFSRKPRPAPMSGATADWDALEKDLDETLAAAKDCNLELVFRDVYRIGGDRPRLRKWAEMAKSKIGV
jgi:hypothetical protein